MWKRVSGKLRLTQSPQFYFFRRIPMHTWLASGPMGRATSLRRVWTLAAILSLLLLLTTAAFAQGQTSSPAQPATISAAPASSTPAHEAGGEANLKLPNMKAVSFMNDSISGFSLLE